MSFEDILRKIPDGPIWVTGDLLKEILQACIEDRARLFETSGEEQPTSQGRFFNIKAAADLPYKDVHFGVNGIVRRGLVPIIFTGLEAEE